MNAVDWTILTPENAEQELEDLVATGQPVSLFALTSDGYTALSMNMAQLLELISQQNSVIAAYEGYYENAELQFDIAGE